LKTTKFEDDFADPLLRFSLPSILSKKSLSENFTTK